MRPLVERRRIAALISIPTLALVINGGAIACDRATELHVQQQQQNQETPTPEDKQKEQQQ